MSDTNWWKTIFDKKYLDTYLADLTSKRTSQEVDFIVNKIPLSQKDKILDLACGHGRHSIELAKRGFDVVGLDYSTPFIEKAKKDSAKAKANVKFIQGDMRSLPFNQEFGVVLMLFTAFGYFNDKQNKQVLNQINKVLKQNGRFLLDVISGEAVKSRFSKEGQKEKSSQILKMKKMVEMGGVMVDETEWYDPEQQLIHNHREWQNKDQKSKYDYFLRVYTVGQYKQMLEHAGFEFKSIWGDFLGNPPSDDNHRTIILAQKK